jgi:hypothetical protein
VWGRRGRQNIFSDERMAQRLLGCSAGMPDGSTKRLVAQWSGLILINSNLPTKVLTDCGAVPSPKPNILWQQALESEKDGLSTCKSLLSEWSTDKAVKEIERKLEEKKNQLCKESSGNQTKENPRFKWNRAETRWKKTPSWERNRTEIKWKKTPAVKRNRTETRWKKTPAVKEVGGTPDKRKPQLWKESSGNQTKENPRFKWNRTEIRWKKNTRCEKESNGNQMKETPQESAMEVTVIKEEDEEEDSCQPLALVTPNNRKHFPPSSALIGVTELMPSPSPLADEATVSTTTPSEATAGGGGGGGAGTPPDSTHQQHTHTHLVSSSQAPGSFKTILYGV